MLGFGHINHLTSKHQQFRWIVLPRAAHGLTGLAGMDACEVTGFRAKNPNGISLNRKRNPSLREKRNKQTLARTAETFRRGYLKEHFTTFWTGKSSGRAAW